MIQQALQDEREVVHKQLQDINYMFNQRLDQMKDPKLFCQNSQ